MRVTRAACGLLGAAWFLLRARWRLRGGGQGAVAAALTPPMVPPVHTGGLCAADAVLAARRVRRVYRRCTCLTFALGLRDWLLHCGHPAVLVIGVPMTGGEFVAHAWVELDGRPIGEASDPTLSFLPLESGQRWSAVHVQSLT